MKATHFSILAFVLLSTVSINSQAQLFKKLKKSVSMAVNNVSDEINSGSGSSNSANTVNPTHADISGYSPTAVYKLQPGESFDFTESCLAMRAGVSSAQVVIIKDGKHYLIGKDGQRTPVSENNIQGCPATYGTSSGNIVDFPSYAYSASNVNADATENFEDLYVHSNNGLSGNLQMQNNMTPQQEKQMEQLADKMDKEQDTGSVNMADAMKAAQLANGINMKGNMHYNKDSAGTFITFNHKRYGPYAIVQSMLVNKAKNKFVAIVTPGEPDMPLTPVSSGSLLITSEGVIKKNNFTAARLLPFGDFNHYRILVQNKMPDDLYDPATGQSIPIINNDENNVKIDKSTGALIQIVNRQIYIDGRLVKTLPDKVNVKPQNIFISEDHKQCAIWTFDGLLLPDGHTIDGVVSCNVQMQNGKKMLNWIVLGKDNKTLMLCHEIL